MTRKNPHTSLQAGFAQGGKVLLQHRWIFDRCSLFVNLQRKLRIELQHFRRLCRKVDNNSLLSTISGIFLTQALQHMVWFGNFATVGHEPRFTTNNENRVVS